MKTKELNEETIKKIVEIIKNYTASKDVKILSKYDFYYNKQKIEYQPKEEIFETGKVLTINAISDGIYRISSYGEISCEILSCGKFVGNFAKKTGEKQKNYFSRVTKELNKIFNGNIQTNILGMVNGKSLSVYFMGKSVTIDRDSVKWSSINDLPENTAQVLQDGLECKIVFSDLSYDEKTEEFNFNIDFVPADKKDDENIQYVLNEEINKQLIEEHMKKWVSPNVREFKLLGEPILGVEISFNKLFCELNTSRSTNEILKEFNSIQQKTNNVGI